MRAIFVALLPIVWCFSAHAQPTTGHSGTGANIDIKHHRLELNINPDNGFRVSGSVTTWFVTMEDNVQTLTFDLIKSSYDNANLVVKYHGTAVSHSFPSSGNQNILTINLPAPIGIGILDSVTIFYDGVPQTPPAGQPGGCFQKTIAGYPLFYTLSESYEDKDWWPCKADMQDKIDSVNFLITTPSAYTVAANGKLISESVSGADKITLFKHKYPIASYQVGIAVTQYVKYDRGTVNIGGTDMPVMYYISKGRTPSTAELASFDLCKDELIAFSQLFGDYPFRNEKYGMYEFGFNGGMEHNTFSGMSWTAFKRPDIVAHELFHQWFGDKVTMGTWNHLWLSEGFASMGEYIAAEKVPATGLNPVTIRGNLKTKANSAAQRNYGCYVPEASIANSVTLWGSQYGNTVYSRGGMVASMLRTLLGEDKFYEACRSYLNDPQLAYRSATTDDLKSHMEAELGGFDLSGFFNSFVYGNGYPDYGNSSGNKIKWQDVGGGKILFKVGPPAKSAGSTVTTYYSVIPLRVNGSMGEEELVVLYDQGADGISLGGDGITIGNANTITVDLGFAPVSVDFDPYNMSLAMGATEQADILPVTILSFNASPNDGQNVVTLRLSDDSDPIAVVLEKSTDGRQFTPVGNMEHSSSGTFRFAEPTNTEKIFYRAKIVEATGVTTYTKIIKLNGKKGTSFRLLTNPVQQTIKIILPAGTTDETFRLSVYDLTGRQISQSSITPANNVLTMGVNSLENGAYLLSIRSTQKEETLRFVVRR